MSAEIQNQSLTAKALFGRQDVQNQFNELLGEKTPGFIASVLQVVDQNSLLKTADPNTVLTAAATAAILDLPVNNNFGFAYIIPYNINTKTPDGWEKRTVAQFQMGYKGFIQLAQRTGLYRRINAIIVHENQFKGFNALTEELEGDFSVMGDGKVVGYAAFFQLKNGFEKLLYATHAQVHAHAKKYSKSYGNKNSLWADETGGADAMGVKTVLKAILSKYGPLSIELQTALKADQSVQTEIGQYEYVDNEQKGIDMEQTDHDKEKARLAAYIEKAKTPEELKKVESYVDTYKLRPEFEDKVNAMTYEQ